MRYSGEWNDMWSDTEGGQIKGGVCFLNWSSRFWLRLDKMERRPWIKTNAQSWHCINKLLHNKLPQTNSLTQYYLILLLKVVNPGGIQLSDLAHCFMRLPSSEALAWAHGLPSKMAYSHSCWNQFPCWLLGESLGSFTWASLKSSLSVLKIWLSWLLECVIQEDAQGRCSAFYGLVSDASLFVSTIF